MTRLYSDASEDPLTAMARRLDEMQREIDQLKTARTAEHTSVGAEGMRFHGGDAIFEGGSNLIIRGGDLLLVDDDGTTIAHLGTLPDGHPGIRFNYDTGAPLFTRQGTPGQQLWGFWDPQGSIIVSNDAESGFGLARPYIPMPLPVPTGVGHWPSTTEPDFETIARSIANVQHPWVSADFRAYAEAGTTGEVRLLFAGSQIGETVAVTDDAFGGEQFEGPIPDGLRFGVGVVVELQARRTAGAGSVYGICRTLYGSQSN